VASCRHQDTGQCQSIIPVSRGCLGCNSSAIESGKEPVAATIPSEHPACSIRAMSGRSKTHDEVSRVRVAKNRNGSCPILLVGK